MWPASCNATQIPIPIAKSTTPSTNVTLCSSLRSPTGLGKSAAQQFSGSAPSPVLGGQHVFHRSRVGLPPLRLAQHCRYRVDDLTEGDAALKEGSHCFFVGRVEHRGNAPAGDSRLFG